MKFKLLLIVLVELLTINCHAATQVYQTDTLKKATNDVNSVPKNAVALRYKAYVSYFDTIAHYPVYVKWELTDAMLNCPIRLKRTNNFAPDPKHYSFSNLASYYNHSGYDRGHNMDALDTECDSTELRECFYYTNMTPQLPALNRGDWKELETYCRTLSKKDKHLTIWCGSVGHNGEIGHMVWIPTQCWKVLLDRKTGIIQAYIMPNNLTVNDFTYDHYKVDVKTVEKLTGYKFN